MTDRQTNDHAGDAPHSDARLIARFERLVERQHELFTSLRRLCDEQTAHIRNDASDDLLRVLAERQTIVDELKAAGDEAAPLRDRWEALAETLPDRRRDALRAKVHALHELANEVDQADRRDRAELERRRAALADQLAGVVRGKGAVAAYTASRESHTGYQDREG